jgi:hypothetical protein
MYNEKEALNRYYWKMHHVRLRKVLPEKIKEAHDRYPEASQASEYVVSQVKPVLEKYSMALEIRLCYYAYAQALYKSQRKLKYMVDLIREHQILRSKWEARGLDPSILDKIDERIIIHKSMGRP